MNPGLLRKLRTLCVAALLAAGPLAAQAPAPPPTTGTADPSRNKPHTPAGADGKPAASDKAFVPSEEVSPDQEVDFPADL